MYKRTLHSRPITVIYPVNHANKTHALVLKGLKPDSFHSAQRCIIIQAEKDGYNLHGPVIICGRHLSGVKTHVLTRKQSCLEKM